MELQEETSNVFGIFQKYAANKETENDLWTQLNKLEEQLENCTISTLETCKKLKCVFENEHFNVSTKYVALQEKHQALRKEITMLEKELNNYKVASTNDMEKLTLQFENRIKQQKNQGIMDMEERQRKIDKGSVDHNKRVQQLYNELDLAQAANALQQDEVETELYKELVDINVKIRQMKNLNDDVRSEIDDLKGRQQSRALQEQNLRTSSCNTEKENFYTDKITITTTFQNEETSNFPENIKIIYEKPTAAINSRRKKTLQTNSHNINNVSKRSHNINKDDMGTKNQPLLSVSGTKPYCDKANENMNNKIKPDITVKKIKKNLDLNIATKCKINLKDNTNKQQNANAPKKRRLFNPDDLDYLNKIDMSNVEK